MVKALIKKILSPIWRYFAIGLGATEKAGGMGGGKEPSEQRKSIVSYTNRACAVGSPKHLLQIGVITSELYRCTWKKVTPQVYIHLP